MNKILYILLICAFGVSGCSKERAREEEKRARLEAETKARAEANAKVENDEATRREIQKKSPDAK